MISLNKGRYSRRRVLRALGLGGAALPLLSTDRAVAQSAPKRLIVFVKSNGTICFDQDFEYEGNTTSFRQLFWPEPVGESLDGVSFPEISKPLEPYRDDLLFLRHVHMRRLGGFGDLNHYNWSMLLTGRAPANGENAGALASGPSIDHHVANVVGQQTPIANLTLGVLTEGPGGSALASWRQSGVANFPNNDPMDVYSKLFAGLDLGDSRREELIRLVAERRSILDFVAGDLARFKRNMGRVDRAQVDAHTDSIREIERQLATTADVPVQGCAAPNTPGVLDHRAGANLPQILKAQTDLMVSALACDMTRVATLSVDSCWGRFIMPWMGDGFDGPSRAFDSGGARNVTHYHDITHAAGLIGTAEDRQRKRQADLWFMEQFAYLLGQLRNRTDPDGTPLLDNTAVLLADPLSNAWRHYWHNLPWVLAGSCGGYFNTGREVKLGTSDAVGDQADINGVLVELANAMGVSTSNFGQYPGDFPQLRA